MKFSTERLGHRWIFFLLFAVSGFSGLIYESIWSHYLKLFLGHAAYAQVLVLAMFMGGMAFGAWFASRVTSRLRNLLLAYAVVEGIIGVLAIVFHKTFVFTVAVSYSEVIPFLSTPWSVELYKWTIGTLLILPQSILLGATFPFMSAGLIRRFPDNPGYSLSILYFTNSLGASIGILVSGFVLIEAVGLPGTVLTAGVVNIMLACVVWLLCRGDARFNGATDSLMEDSQKSTSGINPRLYYAFLLCAGITGAASFLYEIGWIRMLSLVLGSSTHAFELMLSGFIFGLALGGFWIRKRVDRFSSPIKALGVIQILMGLSALATLILYNQTFEWMEYALSAINRTEEGYQSFNLLSHAIAASIMLPATIFAGMTLPLLTFHLVSSGYGERSIGGVYAANTLGSIIGVAAAALIIMPLLGLKNVIVIGASLDLVLGLVLLWHASTKRIQWAAAAITASLAVVLIQALVSFDIHKMASGVYRSGVISSTKQDVLFYRDGRTSTVAVMDIGNYRSIQTNGKPDASVSRDATPSADEPTMILLGTLPWSLNESARTVATIGMGCGLTTNTLLNIPQIERVDTIEIEPAMVQGAELFGKHVWNTFNDPRSHIHIADAKTYFASQNRKYDLIISEPSNPWVSGVSSLFSEEFYSLVRRYISANGLFAQWLHLYEIDMPLVASVIKALSSQFQDYVIYLTAANDMLIVASPESEIGEPGERIFSIDTLKGPLQRIGVTKYDDLVIRKLGSKAVLDPLFNSYAIGRNSDFFPVLDLGAVRTRFLKANASDLELIGIVPVPLLNTLENRPHREQSLSTGENHHLLVAGNIQDAKHILDYFKWVTYKETPLRGNAPKPLVKLMRGFRSVHNQCDPAEINGAWMLELHAVAQRTLPFLTKNEMDIIWNDLKSSPCYNNFPKKAKAWIALYTAVGQWDVDTVTDIGRRLMEEHLENDLPSSNFLLMSVMLAHISKNDTSAASDTWSKYGNEKAVNYLPIRMLLANIEQMEMESTRTAQVKQYETDITLLENSPAVH